MNSDSSSPIVPRVYDFAYRRRNKRFFDSSNQPSCSNNLDLSSAMVKNEENENMASTSQSISTIVISSTSSNNALMDTQVSSAQKPKMLELFDEVSSRWKKQVEESQATATTNETAANEASAEADVKNSSTSNDEDEDINSKKENLNDTAADLFESDSNCGSVADAKQKRKRKKSDSDSDYKQESEVGSDLGENDDEDDQECEISSANSSDSEKKEWLSKARLVQKRINDRARRRRVIAAGGAAALDFYSSIKRRRRGGGGDAGVDDATRLIKSKNSLEMLKQLRQMRRDKITRDDEPTTSRDAMSRDANKSPPEKNADDATRRAHSIERQLTPGSPTVTHSLSPRQMNGVDSKNRTTDSALHEGSPIVTSRKRLVLESDSSDDDDDDEASRLPAKHQNTGLSENNAKDGARGAKSIDDGDESARSVESSSSSSSSGGDQSDDEGAGLGKSIKGRRQVLISSEEEGPNDDKAKEAELAKGAADNLGNRSKKPRKLDPDDIQENTVEFFNGATQDELSSVPRCSARVAEILISRRPFKTYSALIDSVKQARVKGLSVALIEGYAQMLKCQNDLDQLLHSCEKISNVLIESVHQLQDGRGDRRLVAQPELLEPSMQLKPYQLLGLNWLILMFSKDLNCILADEMGLGKTIQVIAFLAYLKQTNVSGPHLVVVPSSTMDNWLCEFRRWCPALNVLTYYGSLEDRKFLRSDIASCRKLEFDVLLSTYRVVTSSSDDRAFLKKLHLYYAIFDEAHMLKNCTTHRYKSLMKIRAQRRLLLTGTPLQNNLVEFISLMHFVMPDLFYDHTENLRDLLQLFQCKTKSMLEYERDKIEQAKSIMRPFVLRRLKCEVLNQLPKKHEFIEFCELADTQLELYGALMTECTKALRTLQQQQEEEQCLASIKNNSRNSAILSNNQARSYLMQLRKAANHPLLLRKHYDDETLAKMAKALCKEKSHRDANPALVIEDMSVMSDFELHRMCKQYKNLTKFKLPAKSITASAKFRALDKLLPEAKTENCKVLLFSQFTMVLDIMEEYLQQRKYKYSRMDGSTPVVERQVLIDTFNSDDDLFVFLLSTKAGGLGINLTSANIIILHDIDYNPYNDRQAEDRCHRLGQTKEVKVIRLIAKNTIDESMLACAQKKLELEKQVTSADNEESNETADMESLLKQALMM